MVIPKETRERLNLNPGTVLKVEVKDRKIILEPVKELPEEIFVHDGARITEPFCVMQNPRVTRHKHSLKSWASIVKSRLRYECHSGA